MRKIILYASVLVAVFMASGCEPKQQISVALEETPVLSGGLGWGVVTLAYARMVVNPSSEATDAGVARRGDVGRVVARSRVFEGRDAGSWYRLEIGSTTGWLHESSVVIYQNEAEARKAAGVGS